MSYRAVVFDWNGTLSNAGVLDMGAAYAEVPPLYAGVTDCIERLARAGYVLCIATMHSRRGIQMEVAHHGIARYFDGVLSADDGLRKPDSGLVVDLLDSLDVLPEQAVVVGDTPSDMRLARNMGGCAVGVTYGACNRDMLLQAGAKLCIDAISELGAFLGL